MQEGDLKGCGVANELLDSIARSTSVNEFRDNALQAIGGGVAGARVAWVHQAGEHWAVAGSAGSLSQLPIELAADACDEMEVLQSDNWLAVPITGRTRPSEVLLVSPANAIDADTAENIAKMLRSGLLICMEQSGLQAQVHHLQTILDLAVDWQRSQDLSELLVSMAKAATRTLNGDRASIFLWDKARSQLVGHPALGVEGEPLRIRDDQGIAGSVLKSCQPERWDESGDPNPD